MNQNFLLDNKTFQVNFFSMHEDKTTKFFLCRLYISKARNTLFSHKYNNIILMEKLFSDAKPLKHYNCLYAIGNIEHDIDIVTFIFGKTSKRSREFYDSAKKIFSQDSIIDGQTRFFIYHKESQVLLMQSSSKIANHVAVTKLFSKFINNQEFVKISGFDCSLRIFYDDTNLIKAIKESRKIISFNFKLFRPNPYIPQTEFIEPLLNILSNSSSEKVEGTLTGEELNKDVTSKYAENVAANGGDASAIIQAKGDNKNKKVKLKDNPIILEAGLKMSRQAVLELVRKAVEKYESFVRKIKQ